MKRKNWAKKELILAFNLYLKLPFGKMHRSNPSIIHFANLIGRTPSSVAMRLTNFASIDPFHQARGISGLKGETKVREIKTRVNQCVFRQIVLTNYNGKCAISGIDIPEFLIASHIIPWSENEKERLNPQNVIRQLSLHILLHI